MLGEGGRRPGRTAGLPACTHAEHGDRHLPGESLVIITSSDHRESQHTVTVILVLGSVGGVTCRGGKFCCLKPPLSSGRLEPGEGKMMVLGSSEEVYSLSTPSWVRVRVGVACVRACGTARWAWSGGSES